MKVLMLNGSPKANGNTALALREIASVLEKEGVEVEIVQVGHLAVRGCVACLSCRKTGKCAIDDIVNELAEKLKEADGMVVASPVYYAAANSTLTAVLDRLFYSSSFDKRMKVGASVAVARRGGTTATFDQLPLSLIIKLILLNKLTLSHLQLTLSLYFSTTQCSFTC